MSLYRCAACGSQKVMLDTQYNGVGYDYLRGAVGTVVLGVGGAAAGIKSQNTQVYKCTECGITLSYTMPEEIKLAIDIGVLDEKARSNLKLANGIPMYWDVLKNRFKNIEKGPADEANEAREQRKQEGLMSCATASKEEFDMAVDHLEVYLRKYCQWFDDPEETGVPSLAEHITFHHAVSVIIENVAKFFPRVSDDSFYMPFDDYKGLSFVLLDKLFLVYLFDKLEIEGPLNTDYGQAPVLPKYVITNPFANSFFNYLDPSYKINVNNLGGLQFKVLEDSTDVFFDDVMFEEKVNDDNRKLLCTVAIPKYIEKYGKIYYNCLSNAKIYSTEKSDFCKEDYFTIFPEKRKIYNEKLEEIKQKIRLNKELENEIASLKTKIEQTRKLIVSKGNEARMLKNKIFGKKKALEAAAELERDAQRLGMQFEEYNTKLKANENQIIKDFNAKAAFIELVKEMDYFVVWRCEEGS